MSTVFDAVGGLQSLLETALATSPGPDPIPVIEGRGASSANWREVVFVASSDGPDEDEHVVASQQWRTVGPAAERDETYTIACALALSAGDYVDDPGAGRERAGEIMAVIDSTLRTPGNLDLGVGQVMWCEISGMNLSYQQSTGLIRVRFNVSVHAIV